MHSQTYRSVPHREFPTETGLYYYRARYYDPSVGRFLNEDPLKHMGKSGNFYEYAFNNTENFADSYLKLTVPLEPGSVTLVSRFS